MEEFSKKDLDRWVIGMSRDNLFIYKRIQRLTKGIIYEDIMWLLFCGLLLVVGSLLFFEHLPFLILFSVVLLVIASLLVFDIREEFIRYKNMSKEIKELEDELKSEFLGENN